MIYYLLLIGAAALFSVQFFFQEKFQKRVGTSSKSAAIFSIGTGLGMALVSLPFVGSGLKITLFSTVVAACHGLASFLYMYFSLKALSTANLSVLSIFTMLGGMLLPVFYGVGLAGETMTVGKAFCCAAVTVSVMLTAGGKRGDKKAILYYLAVFVSNGATSVCAAVHQNYPTMAVDSYSYMVLSSLALMAFGLLFLPFTLKNSETAGFKAALDMAGFSVCSGLGNIVIMISLLKLPASLQFPFSTGAAVVFAAVITLIQGKKPRILDLVSVAVALISTVLIMF